MTDITKQALEAAHAHILDAYRVWQADDISAIPPSGSSAGKALALISAALSRPIDPKAEVEPVAWPVAWQYRMRPNEASAWTAWVEGKEPVENPGQWEIEVRHLYAAPAPLAVTEEMVAAAYRVINESWWSESWDADVPKGLSRRALEAAIAAAPALTPEEKAGVGDGDEPTEFGEPQPKYLVGQMVEKVSGYRWPGVVVARFLTQAQKLRYVVECTVPEVLGALHIYSEEQIAPLRALSTTKPEQGEE